MINDTVTVNDYCYRSKEEVDIAMYGEIKHYKLNLDKVNSLEDCKKILKFLSDLSIKPIHSSLEYNGFNEVKEYYE
jgi:hypothetical protein